MTHSFSFDSNNTSIQAFIEELKNTFNSRELFSFPLEQIKNSFETTATNLPETSYELLNLISNEAVSGALFSYFGLKANYPALVPEDTTCTDALYFKTLNQLIKLEPTQIFPSLTADESIYLRFYTSNNEEIHLEVFYDCEEEGDIEAVVSIYDGHKLLLKDFGSVEQVCNKVYHKLLNRKIASAYQTTGFIAKPQASPETNDQETPDFSTTME